MKVKIVCAAALLCASQMAAADNWSYEGNTGPAHWGQLNKADQTCETGKYQSPINIDTTSIPLSKNKLPVTFHYHFDNDVLSEAFFDPSNNNKNLHPVLIDTGHSLQVTIKNKVPTDRINWHAANYYLQQFHFHTPSETTINGKHYPLEIHFVNYNKFTHKHAVVAVFIAEGKANPTLAEIIKTIPAQHNVEVPLASKNINAADLIPSNSHYYHFLGSLTTPPCTEGLEWLVMQQPIYASAEQIAALEKELHFNSRPVQALNGRVITKYKA